MADGENAIAAKKAASESEGCLESEITIKVISKAFTSANSINEADSNDYS